MFENMTEQQAREQILGIVDNYCRKYHNQEKTFKKGDRIPYASRVYDSKEMVNLVDSALEFWLTAGRYADEFEKKFSEYLGIRFCSLVNSGSSANLLAFMALTSPLLKERQVRPGDEVITVAAGFPTTVAPMIQYGAVPVFVDVTVPQYNIDVTRLEEALSSRTKAVMLAHTLGNPFDLKALSDFCKKHDLWLIEDNCDALGSEYMIDGEKKLTGTIGDIGTSSFYPPHHMTMGEGGAVYTNNPLLHKIVRSLRDWGRDCRCPSGRDNVCGHRFDRQYGELPLGYDHKCPDSDPSWFGFLLTCKEGVDRNKVVPYIESKGVQTRMLFAGNLTKHPCFDQMRAEGRGYRIAGSLENTDRIMRDTFWVGLYPGMTDEKIDYMAKVIREAGNL